MKDRWRATNAQVSLRGTSVRSKASEDALDFAVVLPSSDVYIFRAADASTKVQFMRCASLLSGRVGTFSYTSKALLWRCAAPCECF